MLVNLASFFPIKECYIDSINGDTDGNTVLGLYGHCDCTTETLLLYGCIAMLSCIVFCLHMSYDELVLRPKNSAKHLMYL
jgi:hypothetical protein